MNKIAVLAAGLAIAYGAMNPVYANDHTKLTNPITGETLKIDPATGLFHPIEISPGKSYRDLPPEPIEIIPEKKYQDLPLEEQIQVIKNFQKWLFKPHLHKCLQDLEGIVAKVGYRNSMGSPASYFVELRKIETDLLAIHAFQASDIDFAHEFMHHVDYGCKLMDRTSFEIIYGSIIPPNNKFKQKVEEIIKKSHEAHYRKELGGGYEFERAIWGERIAVSFQLLYRGKPAPDSIERFFGKYVHLDRLPRGKFLEDSFLRQFMQ